MTDYKNHNPTDQTFQIFFERRLNKISNSDCTNDAHIHTRSVHSERTAHTISFEKLSAAEKKRNTAFDQINLSQMVVTFMEHLLALKTQRNMSTEELAMTRSDVESARATLRSAQRDFHNECKAFDEAKSSYLLTRTEVKNPQHMRRHSDKKDVRFA